MAARVFIESGHKRTQMSDIADALGSRKGLFTLSWRARKRAMARRRCRRLIAQGRIALERGESSHLPYPDACFDKAYSVHTIYFGPIPWRT